jgi:hypothetical protein
MMKVIGAGQLFVALVLTGAMLLSGASDAQAFCGFYVSGATKKMYNNATEVVMMREGTRTVLSMRNNYEGPPEDFAMVVPVPQVLEEENVKVLKDDLFDKVDTLAAPRLVEYWQQDPCNRPARRYGAVKSGVVDLSLKDMSMAEEKTAEVVIEAQFDVGEYNVVILSAKESNALEKWLLSNKYNIPKGASGVLASYIAQGQYFFVAKVDPKKVTFKKGQAMLSPLRFHYDSKDFSLPVRLGLLNAKGAQDLIVHILARNQRYQVANYPNVTIPTNLVVPQKTRKNFAEFYTALFDYTLEQHPRAVVTEYSWDASTCDPCPGPTLNQSDLSTLGMDVIDESAKPKRVGLLSIGRATSGEVEGQELANAVWQKAQTSQPALRGCYTKHIEGGGKSVGRVNMVLTITPKGTISKVERPWDSLKEESITGCFEKEIKTWSFAKQASNKKDVQVALPLTTSSYIETPRRSRSWRGWTLTRLHTRYTDKTMTEDLIFEKAPGIIGGRGMPQGEQGEMNEEGVVASSYNNFQGRYIMLNYYKGKLSCDKEDRYWRWGGPPSSKEQETFTAQDTAFVPRGKVKLTKGVKKAAKLHFDADKKLNK